MALLAHPAVAAAQQTATASPTPPAQVQTARIYKPNIADDDWSFLANPAYRQDRFDPIKYISLFGGKSYPDAGR